MFLSQEQVTEFLVFLEIHRTNKHRCFEGASGTGGIALFLKQVGKLHDGFIAGLGIGDEFFQNVDCSLLVALLEIGIGKRLVRVVLVRILRIEIDRLIQDLDSLVRIAFCQRFLSRADKLGERLHLEVLDLVINPLEEFHIELLESHA